jgi:2',3'-cyclic-nucleotide 2'-phosphodiesterase (5'-nucleotidase family)
LTILHTNDMHGHLDERPLGKDREPGGGIARIAGAALRVRREVEASGGFAVLVDAGDFYAGTPEGNLTRGRLVVELMNAAGYDLACPGNHEFDDGPGNLAKLSELARFPFTAANVREKGSGAPPPWARACVYRDFGSVRAAFVGLLTPETGIITTGAGTFEFEDEAAALRRAVARARGRGRSSSWP